MHRKTSITGSESIGIHEIPFKNMSLTHFCPEIVLKVWTNMRCDFIQMKYNPIKCVKQSRIECVQVHNLRFTTWLVLQNTRISHNLAPKPWIFCLCFFFYPWNMSTLTNRQSFNILLCVYFGMNTKWRRRSFHRFIWMGNLKIAFHRK